MKKNLSKLLKEVLDGIKPSNSDTEKLKEIISDFISILELEVKKRKVSAKTFLGGSIAKGTMIRKKRYDIDLFVRFDCSKYKDKERDLGKILEKSIFESFEKFKGLSKGNSKFKLEKIHGSRDYFNIHFYSNELEMNLILEIVPTLSIKKPGQAMNITDLSFFHVKYIANKLKGNNLMEDIMIAKAFCYAQRCYGAESYIKGFSGYAIELLVIYYRGFERFVRNAALWREKIIIDMEKSYKNEEEILSNINEAKLQSPIILIDPTYSVRNVCAAVSKETFERFIEACRDFIKNPGKDSFIERKTERGELIKEAKRKNSKLASLIIKTKRDNEGIAASKILKFYNFFLYQMKINDFKTIRKEIEFMGFKEGSYQAAVHLIYKEPSKLKVVQGPPLTMKEHAEKFKKKYKNYSIKGNKVHARIRREIADINKLVASIRKRTEMKDMQISSISLIKS